MDHPNGESRELSARSAQSLYDARERPSAASEFDPEEMHAPPKPDRMGEIRGLSLSGFHRIAYADWGPLDAKETVVCVHGLSRQGRDFDFLAAALAANGYRVLCPDLAGRGQSDWLPDVMGYVFPQYCADMGVLLATVQSKVVHWIGTSLGGLIGIVLAGSANSPISTLTVNDIGPDVPSMASARVGMRLAREQTWFASLADAERYFRRIHSTCGPLTDAQWRHMAVHSIRFDHQRGCYVQRLDPKVATAYHWLWYYSMTLWNYWRNIERPILAIHGEQSDFTSQLLIRKMKLAAPQMRSFAVPEIGHMPMLMDQMQIDAVKMFLKSNSSLTGEDQNVRGHGRNRQTAGF